MFPQTAAFSHLSTVYDYYISLTFFTNHEIKIFFTFHVYNYYPWYFYTTCVTQTSPSLTYYLPRTFLVIKNNGTQNRSLSSSPDARLANNQQQLIVIDTQTSQVDKRAKQNKTKKKKAEDSRKGTVSVFVWPCFLLAAGSIQQARVDRSILAPGPRQL